MTKETKYKEETSYIIQLSSGRYISHISTYEGEVQAIETVEDKLQSEKFYLTNADDKKMFVSPDKDIEVVVRALNNTFNSHFNVTKQTKVTVEEESICDDFIVNNNGVNSFEIKENGDIEIKGVAGWVSYFSPEVTTALLQKRLEDFWKKANEDSMKL